jgi:hypothetical protein
MSTTPARPRHGRETYAIEGEGTFDLSGRAARTGAAARTAPTARTAETAAEVAPAFRFSRIGPTGQRLDRNIRVKLARAMTSGTNADGRMPAGFTYLGQFVDHDLTFDRTTVMFGDDISPIQLLQGRSPALDLDSVYGAGPFDAGSSKFYSGLKLKLGRTTAVGPLVARDGFDLPRGAGSTVDAKRKAVIPDPRNDENLAVASHHLAFLRLHNRVLSKISGSLSPEERFRRARQRVVRHYQWMLRTDYLPRICDRAVVDDVFTNGRKIFEPGASPLSMPTMPVEFSVAAFRLGHSMIREDYDWNAEFPDGGGTLDFLFTFSATSGDLGGNPTLPSNWITDWRRLYRLTQSERPDLAPPAGEFNLARRIDTVLVDPLSALPAGSFGGDPTAPLTIEANLAFRNLTRATMLHLASGQQMADFLNSKGVPVTKLTTAQLRDGLDGASLDSLTDTQRATFFARTPLWFYVLREAELNNGRLGAVGGRIVAETFHRAMEGSEFSIVRSPEFRPNLGTVEGRFTMADLLIFAYNGDVAQLAPLG